MSAQSPLSRLILFPLLSVCLAVSGCDEEDSPDDEYGEEGEHGGDDDDAPASDGPACINTCEYANDGDCDDGGPGSDYSVCAYGTDCGDCGPRDGGDPISSDDSDEPPAQEWACEFTRHSRTACPGYPNDISESERCVTVTAASSAEAQSACSEFTASDTDCYGGCCTRYYSSGITVTEGACY